MDLSAFNDVPGLLTPEQNSNANSQALLSAGAALMKAAAPSPYKNNTWAGLGEGVQGYVQGHNQGTDQALKQQLVRGQIGGQQMALLAKIAEYRAAGLPVPPQLQKMFDMLGGAGGTGGQAAVAAPAQASPVIQAGAVAPGPQGAPAAPVGLLNPPPGAPAAGPAMPPQAPPAGLLGGTPQSPTVPAPAAASPDKLGAALAEAGLSRYGLVGDGPISKLTQAVIAKNLERTEAEKNAANPAVSAAKLADEQAAKDLAEKSKFFGSVYRGTTGSATVAAQQKQNIGLLRDIAANPDFISGAGSDAALALQRIAANLPGFKPTSAAPRELFNQVAARVLADQFSGIKSMASETGEQGARIFKPMLDLEEKANITPSDSLAGVKAKIDLLDKAGDHMMRWGDMADDYQQKHGHLDEGFTKLLRADMAKSRIEGVLPKDEPAAAAASASASGYHLRTATNPKTGDQLINVNGTWMPAKQAIPKLGGM